MIFIYNSYSISNNTIQYNTNTENFEMAFERNLTVYIPRINGYWADESKIREVFENQQLGTVKGVDFIYKKSTAEIRELRKKRQSENVKFTRSAIVHFTEWYDNAPVRALHAAINDPNNEARVVCDAPWYWLLLRSDQQPLTAQSPRKNMSPTRIQTRKAINEEVQAGIEQWITETHPQVNKQDEAASMLQLFCIRNGLNIPFWSNETKPSEKATRLEMMAAETAVNCATLVLN